MPAAVLTRCRLYADAHGTRRRLCDHGDIYGLTWSHGSRVHTGSRYSTEHSQCCYLGPSTGGSLLGRILGAGANFPAYAFLEVFDLGDALRPLMTGTIDALMATVTWVRVRVKSRD